MITLRIVGHNDCEYFLVDGVDELSKVHKTSIYSIFELRIKICITLVRGHDKISTFMFHKVV